MATIRPFDASDPSKGFLADTGTRGPGARKLCRTREDAEAFLAARHKNPTPAKVLHEREAELMDCYERLAAVGATFREAVEFFIKFGARKGHPTFSELVEKVVAEKAQAQMAAKYLDTLRNAATRLLAFLDDDPKVMDISEDQLREFFYVANKRIAKGYRRSLFTHLNVFFRYALTHQLIVTNKLALIQRPTRHKANPPKAIRPEHLERLLGCCYEKPWHDRLVVFVLMAFVGIRKQEVSRLRWDSIDYERKQITLQGEAVKAGDIFRRLDIPPNAMEWLELVRDKRRKKQALIGRTWESLCRSAILSAKIPYSKNALRNAFPSYAIEAGWDENVVKKHMGHTKNSKIVWEHYVAQVEKSAAKKFWSLTPQRVFLKKPWAEFKASPRFGNSPSRPFNPRLDDKEFLPEDADFHRN